MVTLIKISTAIIATLTFTTIDSYYSNCTIQEPIVHYSSMASAKTCQEKAYQILESKCNLCHRKRNKRQIFTQENMNDWANDIYTQVFVKKRMPKDKEIRLDSQD